MKFEETWPAMEEIVRLGLAKSIGISNFNSEQIERILKIAKIKPVVNQVKSIYSKYVGVDVRTILYQSACILKSNSHRSSVIHTSVRKS